MNPNLPLFDVNQDDFHNEFDPARLARSIIGLSSEEIRFQITFPPRDLLYTSDSNLEVTGEMIDTADISILGESLGQISGPFAATVSLTEGLNLIEFLTEDDAGNLTVKSRAVLLDLTPPQLTVNEPTLSTAYPRLSAPVSGVVSDNVAGQVGFGGRRFNRARGTIDPGTFTPELLVEIISVSIPDENEIERKTIPVDEFGRFDTEIALAQGLNDVYITAIDSAGLESEVIVRTRCFLSEEMDVVSPGGATISLPEGALGDEDMTVRLFDVTTNEIEDILNFDLLSLPPAGGLDGFEPGDIVLPNGMMLEVEAAPLVSDKLFEVTPSIAIPNVTNADNSMPLWIFSVTPDRDGDGRPEFDLVSRAEVTEDGSMVVPKNEGVEVDNDLPGPFGIANRRFEETELNQVADAAAVRNLQARLRGSASQLNEGSNVGSYRPAKAKKVSSPSKETVPVLLEVPNATFLKNSPAKGSPTIIMIDDFEDGNRLNLLEPSGLSFVTESTSSIGNSTNPILPRTLTSADIPGKGSATGTTGVRGGLHASGNFAESPAIGRLLFTTSFLGRNESWNLTTVQSPVLTFDAKSNSAVDVEFEVTIEDASGLQNTVSFAPASGWAPVSVPLGSFGQLDLSTLRRVTWIASGPAGSFVDLSIDNIRVSVTGGAAPPSPTPLPSPTGTPEPTPTGATPSPSPTITPSPTPMPTETPMPTMVATRTPVSPTPTDDPPTIETPVSTPIPTATPDNDPPEKTQITFFCCAASAVIPVKGKTKCDDQENIDQQRLQFCREQLTQELVSCQNLINLFTAELQGESDRMLAGSDNAFGVVEISGKRIYTIVGGSLFNCVTVTAGSQKAGLVKTGLTATSDGLASISDFEQAISNQSGTELLQSYAAFQQRQLNATVNLATSFDQDSLPDGLKSRQGFRNSWDAVNAAKNCYDAVSSTFDMGDGYRRTFELIDLVQDLQFKSDRIVRQLHKVKQCQRGENVWIRDCDDLNFRSEEERLEAIRKDADLSRIYQQSRIIVERAERVREGIEVFRKQLDTFTGSIETMRDSFDMALNLEERLDSLSEPEIKAEMMQIAQRSRTGMEGFQLMLQDTSKNEQALLDVSTGLDLPNLVERQIEDVTDHVNNIVEFDSMTSQGESGVVVSLGEELGSSTSRLGGEFTSYRFATSRRTGDTVTFSAVQTNAVASLPQTLWQGSAPVTIPPLTFQFTPFSTIDYDAIVNVGTISMTTGVDDRQGNPPETELTTPASTVRGSEGVIFPPDVPFYAKASADDDIVVFAGRFRIDGEPTVSFGTTDSVDLPEASTYSGYFLTPDLEEDEESRTFVVQSEVIDAGGNITLSEPTTVTVDRDAPLLLTVSPDRANTTIEGPNIQFTATRTGTDEIVEDTVWFVDGILGGSDRVGRINENGLYSPPERILRNALSVEIQAVSDLEPNLIGLATVNILEPFGVFDYKFVLNTIIPAPVGKASVYNGPVRTLDTKAVFNAPIKTLDTKAVFNPYTSNSLSGYDISPPVAVDQTAP